MGKYLNVLEVYFDSDICKDNKILCVFTMFEYYLSNKISTNGIKKLIVTFSLNQSEITVNEVLGIMNAMAPFDKIDFIKSKDVIEKRMILLDSLEKVI